MKYLLPLLLLSCTEVSISKRPDIIVDSSTIGDTAPPPNETSTEPASEPSTEPPEGIGGYVHYHLRQVACLACMGETNEITVQFDSRFHEKIFDTYTRHIPAQGQCTQNVTEVVPLVELYDMGAEIKARTGNTTLNAYKTMDGNYVGTWFTDSIYIRDAVHTISREDDYDFAQFTSFHGFDSIEPFELRYVDISYAFAAPIYRSGATFWWAPYGSNSTFTIMLAVYSPDGASLLGYVACSSGDTGMMTIPGQYLSSYPTWALVAVHLTRHKIERVLWEEENTYIETHMEWEVVGTGHIE
jgi:hypothetical protein